MTLARFCLLTLLCISSSATAQKQSIIAYTYHLKPPFITGLAEEQGLYFDLSVLMSQQKEYEFFTVFMPRKRLDKILEQGKLDGIVLGANPVWFKDKAQTKYFWSSPFLSDRDEFVSLPSLAFEYRGAQSLLGRTLAGVRGYFYVNIEPLVTDGKIRRFDSIGENEVLQMVLKGRADIGIVSRSTFDYIRQKKPELNLLYISQQPHDQFNRHIMVPKDLPEVYENLEGLLSSESFQDKWRVLVEAYGYDTLE